MSARAASLANPEPVVVFAAAREKAAEIEARLSAEETLGMTHAEVERSLFTDGMELLRRMYEGHLLLRGNGEVEAGSVVGADGVERTHYRLHPRRLETIFGTVSLERVGYGARGEESLHVLDADVNLPVGLYSHEVRRRVAEVACKQSFDETVEAVATTTAASVPKRQAEDLVVFAAEDFDDFYKTRAISSPEQVAATGPIGVITSDAKGVTMRQEDLRPKTRRAAERRRAERARQGAFTVGQPKPTEVASDRKRMAAVAAVYTIVPFVRTPEDVIGELERVHLVAKKRPRPEHKRVWARLTHSIAENLEEAFAEAARRDPERVKRWVGLVDGDEDQIAALKRLARATGFKLTIILDLLHVALYVWKAAWAFHERGSPEAQAWVRERLGEILRGRSSLVAAGMRRSATLRGLAPSKRAAVDKCADYLLKYAEYLRYDEYLAAGLPIATGVIEGACRHLVQDRMEITGAVWGLETAEAVLKLRSLHASGDFDEYWNFYERQERRLNHDDFYAGGTAPSVLRPATLLTPQERHPDPQARPMTSPLIK
jgi:hypothetical protein